eukprot:TRINITY_DN1226_c0_g1_i6.p3 TRINITY_DN1226_c0_g1~~TRINITY_DN1226_c0_g1_i6.p3  ORF type:complete len:145 (+),score=77.97 TRINITY_DN1226_c0_g1_i6:39-437(+)
MVSMVASMVVGSQVDSAKKSMGIGLSPEEKEAAEKAKKDAKTAKEKGSAEAKALDEKYKKSRDGRDDRTAARQAEIRAKLGIDASHPVGTSAGAASMTADAKAGGAVSPAEAAKPPSKKDGVAYCKVTCALM